VTQLILFPADFRPIPTHQGIYAQQPSFCNDLPGFAEHDGNVLRVEEKEVNPKEKG
jgi:hypothetical protein